MSSFVKISSCLLWISTICLLFTSASADGLNPQSRPAANEIIPVGEPYTIVWSPGTSGNVTIVLMANSNWKAQTIASSTPNSGTYTWTPEASLASDNSGNNYFLQICETGDANECTYTYDGRFAFTDSQAVSTSSTLSSALASTASISSASYVPTISSTSSTTSSFLPAGSSTLSSAVSSTASEVTGSATGSTGSTGATASAVASSSGTASGGLSTTAKIAIGVVLSIVGTAALLVGGFILFRRHRRSKSTPVYDEKSAYEQQPAKAELYDSSLNPSELPVTTSNTAPARLHELDTQPRILGHMGQP